METHVKVIAILHIVFGVLGLLGALFLLLFFGGVAGMVGMSSDDAAAAIPILGIVGIFVVAWSTFISIPQLIAGLGLLGLRPWSRILSIILSIVSLINFPFGTALGIYALWVMLKPETVDLFEARFASAPQV